MARRTNGKSTEDERRWRKRRKEKRYDEKREESHKAPQKRIATEEVPLREPVIAEKFDSSEGSEEKR